LSIQTRSKILGFGTAAVLLLGAFPAAQIWKEMEQRRERAIQKFKEDILREALEGARGNAPRWNDAPLSLPADLYWRTEEGVDREPDPLMRQAALARYRGSGDPRTLRVALEEVRKEAARRSANGPRDPLDPIDDTATWVGIGPTDARFEVNGGIYFQNDSGRATHIRVDPRDPNILYHGTATGGIWKSYNALDDNPVWIPITEDIGGMAIGAMDIDPANPDTLYIAIGDAYDVAEGGHVLRSTTGGGDWTLLTEQLRGTYPDSAGGRTETANQMRDMKVDPHNSNHILIATEVGLFRSTDAGQSFVLVPLPTWPNGTIDREASASAVVYLGTANGESQWLVAGQPACGTPRFPFPPRRSYYGLPPDPTNPDCPDGNMGDIWKSADGGATWSSRRVEGGLGHYGPDDPYMIGQWKDVGRMALGASNPDPSDPEHAVVYAWAEASREIGISGQPGLLAVLKSTDGGETFLVAAKGIDPVINPTTGSACRRVDVGNGQAWYNQGLAVDPIDPNNVLIGGNLCGARSRDGGQTWENVSHWLPHAGGDTGDGRLAYVHADWHAGAIMHWGNQIITFAGTDGGSFRATNLFSENRPVLVNWKSLNRGITSHQLYSIGSGDPVDGDEFLAFSGLQDNGTRIRDDQSDTDTVFDQVIGGDGVASIRLRVTDTLPPTARRVLFAALPGGPRNACRTPLTGNDCNVPAGAWFGLTIPVPSGDSDPFLIKYASFPRTGPDDSEQLITVSTNNVFRLYYIPGQSGGPNAYLGNRRLSAWTNPSDPNNSFYIDGASQPIRNVNTSPTLYTDERGAFRLIGVSLGRNERVVAPGGGYFSVGIDRSPTVTDVDVEWRNSAQLGVGPNDNQKLVGTSSVTFPSSAANFLEGAVDGQVYLVTSFAARMSDNTTQVPDEIGHLFLTTDFGQTWTPFHGTGCGFDLPNIPASQVVFDPRDSTDQTIYALTDIGVYRTIDRGETWRRFGIGLPMARAEQMFISANGGLIRVGTYSRGVWEIYPNATEARGVRGDGDWDRNLQIDFIDLGALASRLGTSPVTTQRPLFDWNLALGNTNSVTESDLIALLAKFGQHP
jgi:hypothetical protein